MTYFVDFYSVVRIYDAGENRPRKTNIVRFLMAPYFRQVVFRQFLNYDLRLGASHFTPFAKGCSV